MTKKTNTKRREIQFIKDCIDSKKTNEQLLKEYGFNSNKEMFAEFNKVNSTYGFVIPNQLSKEEANALRQGINKAMESLQ